jgi:hypothetical protein
MNNFVKLVAEMRNKQKEYFKSRSFQSLNEAKQLEKDVDKAIKDFSKPKEEQPGLGL